MPEAICDPSEACAITMNWTSFVLKARAESCPPL